MNGVPREDYALTNEQQYDQNSGLDVVKLGDTGARVGLLAGLRTVAMDEYIEVWWDAYRAYTDV